MMGSARVSHGGSDGTITLRWSLLELWRLDTSDHWWFDANWPINEVRVQVLCQFFSVALRRWVIHLLLWLLYLLLGWRFRCLVHVQTSKNTGHHVILWRLNIQLHSR